MFPNKGYRHPGRASIFLHYRRHDPLSWVYDRGTSITETLRLRSRSGEIFMTDHHISTTLDQVRKNKSDTNQTPPRAAEQAELAASIVAHGLLEKWHKLHCTKELSKFREINIRLA